MATYSSNTTIKVNNAIAYSYSGGGGGDIVAYTAPANGYAIIHVLYWSTGSTPYIYSGGISFNTVTFLGSPNGVSDSLNAAMYLGPGQSIRHNSSGAGIIKIQGVEFINS